MKQTHLAYADTFSGMLPVIILSTGEHSHVVQMTSRGWPTNYPYGVVFSHGVDRVLHRSRRVVRGGQLRIAANCAVQGCAMRAAHQGECETLVSRRMVADSVVKQVWR